MLRDVLATGAGMSIAYSRGFSTMHLIILTPLEAPYRSPFARRYDLAVNPSSHRHALLGRISPLSQRNNYNTHDAPPRSSFLEWARSTAFDLTDRRDNEGIQLQSRSPATVNVPVAHGNYVSLLWPAEMTNW